MMAPPGWIPKVKRIPDVKKCKNPECNITFETTRKNKEYHSQACGMKHWLKLRSRVLKEEKGNEK